MAIYQFFIALGIVLLVLQNVTATDGVSYLKLSISLRIDGLAACIKSCLECTEIFASYFERALDSPGLSTNFETTTEWEMIVVHPVTYQPVDDDIGSGSEYLDYNLSFEVYVRQGIHNLSPEDSFDWAKEHIASTIQYGILSDFVRQGPYLDGVFLQRGSLAIDDEYILVSKEEAIRYRHSTDGLSHGHICQPPIIEDLQKIRLLLLGDWGKGGVTGDISKVYVTSSMDMTLKSAAVDNSSVFKTSRELQTLTPLSMNYDMGSKSKKMAYTYQASVARSLNRYINETGGPLEFAAIIALGDNFYDNGVQSTSDSLWKTLWTDVYRNGSALDIPWYAVLGNHDWGSGETGVRAQIDKTFETTPQAEPVGNTWHMPAENYTVKFQQGGSDEGVSIVALFIDTTTLAPSENKCCNSKGGISEDLQAQRISNQLHHIESSLIAANEQNPRPTWIIVAGHYPVFSAGEHLDIKELKEYLQPLLKKYNVDAYFSGHDHISEHLSKDGIHYFVAGAGSMIDKLGSSASDATLHWSGTGFASFATATATKSSFVVEFVNTFGDIVYRYNVTKDSISNRETFAPSEDFEDINQSEEESDDVNGYIQNFVGSLSRFATFLAGLFVGVSFASLIVFLVRKSCKRNSETHSAVEQQSNHGANRDEVTLSYDYSQYENRSPCWNEKSNGKKTVNPLLLNEANDGPRLSESDAAASSNTDKISSFSFFKTSHPYRFSATLKPFSIDGPYSMLGTVQPDDAINAQQPTRMQQVATKRTIPVTDGDGEIMEASV